MKEEMNFCIHCGSSIDQEKAVCDNCGKSTDFTKIDLKNFLKEHISSDIKGRVTDKLYDLVKNFLISRLYGLVITVSVIFTVTSTVQSMSASKLPDHIAEVEAAVINEFPVEEVVEEVVEVIPSYTLEELDKAFTNGMYASTGWAFLIDLPLEKRIELYTPIALYLEHEVGRAIEDNDTAGLIVDLEILEDRLEDAYLYMEDEEACFKARKRWAEYTNTPDYVEDNNLYQSAYLIQNEIFVYDRLGRIIQWEANSFIFNDYYEVGFRLSKVVSGDPQSGGSEEDYFYDDLGRLSYFQAIGNGHVETTTYTYDGNTVIVDETGEDRDPVHREFTFDEYGNIDPNLWFSRD